MAAFFYYPCCYTYAVGDRDAINFGFQYERLLDPRRYNPNGYGMSFGTDYRWKDLHLLSVNIDMSSLSTASGIDPSGYVFIGKFHTEYGLSYFLPHGKLGAQLKAGPGAIFLRDGSKGENRKTPGLGLMGGFAFVWRPFYVSKNGYNSFVISLRADLWRYFFIQPFLGKTSLTIGPLFGVEF
ncbi:MAG: hypothetical protein JWQ35_2530 [Bacteriovoracaceae bacterium]|nr:hypothetical protein [Bacteriovoracaceae bacterium]